MFGVLSTNSSGSGAANQPAHDLPLPWINRLENAINRQNIAVVQDLLREKTIAQLDESEGRNVQVFLLDAINKRVPDNQMICELIWAFPENRRLELFQNNKTVIPSPVVGDLNLARFYIANGFEPQIASNDFQRVHDDVHNLVFSYQFPKQLTATNQNPDFWERLDSSHAHEHHHDHDSHGHDAVDEPAYKVEGNFKVAQEKIQEVINTVFENLRSETPNVPNASEDIFLLYAFIKAQDQGAPIHGFVMLERRQFEKIFNVRNDGKKNNNR